MNMQNEKRIHNYVDCYLFLRGKLRMYIDPILYMPYIETPKGHKKTLLTTAAPAQGWETSELELADGEESF